jgi:hypothetical protein
VNVNTQVRRQQPSTPTIQFPFLGKHEGLLFKAPKNDTKEIRRKSVDRQKAMSAEIADFANFESNGDEAALPFEQSRYAGLVVCIWQNNNAGEAES